MDTTFVQKVRHGLSSISNTVLADTQEISPEVQDSEVAAIDLDKLVLNSELAFAIIDDRDQVKDRTQRVVARLHQFADRQAGVLLVCATRSYLAQLFKGPMKLSDKYFPSSLRAKINYKLGGTNFETGLYPLVVDEGLMIASGHVAHRNSSKSYSPSISAVVATCDHACSQYFGSIRLGPTTKYLPIKTEFFDRRMCSDLQDLHSMMVERLKKSEYPPTKILFFRDSMNFDQDFSEFDENCKMNKTAYKVVFPDIKSPVQIVYVVVNKNIEIRKVSTSNIGNTAVPIFDYVLDGHATSKYRY
jgi:hypothetical protein